MSTGLVRYDAACKALAAAKSVDVAKHIRDTHDAMRIYAKQAKNKTLEVDCAEIRIRAERRIGELIAAQRQGIGLNRGAKGTISGGKKTPVKDPRPTLAAAGIDKDFAKRARKFAAVADEQFELLVDEWRARVLAETERVTVNMLREGDRDHIAGARPTRPLPVGQFRLIYADPPWQYEHIATESRAIENQYPTMPLEAICDLPVPAAPDAVLFLWATSPKLAEAMQVIERWDFSYRTCAIWDKERMGMGYYFRQQHELLLVAARGALPVPEPSDRPPSVIRLPRGAHSDKPAIVYGLIERMYPTFTADDRLELFARQSRAGWTMWGNEPAVAL
jgi:N6-adenosine-specific RNA methylase IME4